MAAITTDDVASKWYRFLEGFILAWAVGAGLAFSALVIGLTVGPAVLAASASVIVVLLGLILAIGLAPLVFLDARAVSKAEIEWDPSPVLYAIGTFLLSIIGLHYLYVRQSKIRPANGNGNWWYLIPAAVVVALIGIAAQSLSPAAVATVGIVLALLTLGVYKDAVYLNSIEADWQPSPATHLLIAFFSVVLPFIFPFYVVYYLYKRHKAVGLTLPSSQQRRTTASGEE